MTKIYVARVLGAVPWETLTVEAPLTYNASKRVALVDAATGKPSSTSFVRLFVEPDGLTSVVECRCVAPCRALRWALHTDSCGEREGQTAGHE